MTMTAEQTRDALVEEYRDEGLTPGKLFGSFAISLDGKVVATFSGERAVFKIGRDSALLADALAGGASLFDPSGKGRPMKDWVVLPLAGSDLDAYLLEAVALQRS